MSEKVAIITANFITGILEQSKKQLLWKSLRKWPPVSWGIPALSFPVRIPLVIPGPNAYTKLYLKAFSCAYGIRVFCGNFFGLGHGLFEGFLQTRVTNFSRVASSPLMIFPVKISSLARSLDNRSRMVYEALMSGINPHFISIIDILAWVYKYGYQHPLKANIS